MIRLMHDAPALLGFRCTCPDTDLLAAAPDTTTEEYDREQQRNNVRVTREYVKPICERTGSRTILDVGCGVGTSVLTLLEDGYDAYGVDLPGLTPYWDRMGCSRDRFFVIAPVNHRLPFEDDAVDLAYSFGVLEHIGTEDGHSRRAADYHEQRRQWLREIYRCVRPGGYLLMGGPNRRFPFDFSHGLDAASSRLEHWASRRMRFTVHRTWGEYFLWSYEDFGRYLDGLPHQMEALSIAGLLRYGRVPGPARWFADAYVRRLPRDLRSTGLNPWVMALIRKGGAEGATS